MQPRSLPPLAVVALIATASASVAQPPERAGSAAARALENRERGMARRSVTENVTRQGIVPSLDRGRSANSSANARALERRPDFVVPGRGTGRLARDVERGRAFGWSRQQERRSVDRWERVRRSRGDEESARTNPEDVRADRRDPTRRSDDRLGLEFTTAERLLAKRLAQIDVMRNRALETGNENLYRQADHLERIARQQFARRTFEGERRDRNEQLPLRPVDVPRRVEPSDDVPEVAPPTDDGTPITSEG